MTRISFIICLLLIVFSCKPDKVSETINGQVTIDDETMLLGPIDRESLRLQDYAPWFDSTYHAYSPKVIVVDSLESLIQEVELKVFMATWCSDSRRDVPALYRILDEIDYDYQQMSLVATDRSKTLPLSELEGFDIEFVPTIIISLNGQELGRITEFPDQTLEEDMLKMLKS